MTVRVRRTTPRWHTHELRLGTDEVTKRYHDTQAEPAEREWRALVLLQRHAPGLAPRPLRRTPGRHPDLVMSRLPGEPLRGTPVAGPALVALADSVARLLDAVPPAAAAALPERRAGRAEATAQIRQWYARRTPTAREPAVAAVLAEGMRWLERPWPAVAEEAGLEPVLGQGDGNLANFLWDGERVRVVDFEESGRSDRAFELAEITEHVGSWVDPGTAFDAEEFLGLVPLDAGERVRLLECRRLIALVWLLMLTRDDPARPRNPRGTVRAQAARLDALLGQVC
ncbi:MULTISPECIES: aminoglycoside phosphotransferase family protein [unclassified Streptomyces]|uniref:aminoglycoside phosphotransferase family protein n=1 Tax=unclassified Streptomyces TaxID=2593676 RepID=UPI00081E36E1|nr:aminoglycoside phosphotransferase family protein [Streptomyces sp. LcepLS]MYR27988.1 phosphotransferase [Streptomyces sp. SID4945]SCF32355.1 Phosphotransferase enzyme family protein [Streptomyces sp. LcepLS]